MQNEMNIRDLVSLPLGEIVFGTFFLLVGLTAAGITLLRRGKSMRILVGLALWSGAYGARLLILSSAVRMHLHRPYPFPITLFDVSASYLMVVFALLAWLDLTRGALRLLMKTLMWTGSAIGVAGIGWFLVRGEPETWMLYNNLLASFGLLAMIIFLFGKKLSARFLVLPNRGVLAAGTLLFAAEALYSNLSRLFLYRTSPILGWLGFAALLISLAYTAAKMIFDSERRLLAIENEMETARKIQASILPAGVPEIVTLNVAVSYHPMTAVAGDFYDFIEIDAHRAGFLVADVSGHGVPAALIASMIKVAMKTSLPSARDPGKVLRHLADVLGSQLHDRFVTAAYLYLDTETGQARYAAAGHPPMLYWDSSVKETRFIESNGPLIGFCMEKAYPVREIGFRSQDRFLLYTDGLTEAENAAEEAFGDRHLAELIRSHAHAPADELNAQILRAFRSWRNPRIPQQDDLTWIIVDIS